MEDIPSKNNRLVLKIIIGIFTWTAHLQEDLNFNAFFAINLTKLATIQPTSMASLSPPGPGAKEGTEMPAGELKWLNRTGDPACYFCHSVNDIHAKRARHLREIMNFKLLSTRPVGCHYKQNSWFSSSKPFFVIYISFSRSLQSLVTLLNF